MITWLRRNRFFMSIVVLLTGIVLLPVQPMPIIGVLGSPEFTRALVAIAFAMVDAFVCLGMRDAKDTQDIGWWPIIITSVVTIAGWVLLFGALVFRIPLGSGEAFKVGVLAVIAVACAWWTFGLDDVRHKAVDFLISAQLVAVPFLTWVIPWLVTLLWRSAGLKAFITGIASWIGIHAGLHMAPQALLSTSISLVLMYAFNVLFLLAISKKQEKKEQGTTTGESVALPPMVQGGGPGEEYEQPNQPYYQPQQPYGYGQQPNQPYYQPQQPYGYGQQPNQPYYQPQSPQPTQSQKEQQPLSSLEKGTGVQLENVRIWVTTSEKKPQKRYQSSAQIQGIVERHESEWTVIIVAVANGSPLGEKVGSDEWPVQYKLWRSTSVRYRKLSQERTKEIQEIVVKARKAKRIFDPNAK